MNELKINELKAYYKKNLALKNISIDIPLNKVTAIIGPSGCGKSTFLRCLNRMHETIKGARVEGTVQLKESDLYKMDVMKVRQEIGMVFQSPNPFPKMSIFDNVASGLKFKGIRNKKMVRGIVEESLKNAALWEEVKDRLNAKATELSGGQQQRLCIARTLAMKPEIILMDEPASALDPISTMKIEELIHKLKERYSIIIVTHNMEQAKRVSEMTAFFLNGELVEFLETDELFSNPKMKETENYIAGRFG
ncbi:phosphate import ATP-binding protein PstB [Sporolactobacillus terrae]|uniref:Phosphate import ATP-binding protein PstB n=2 Tax=Sporolactobacillus terrae TaxID=269673 RepID=A0A5K7WYR4_9BACL|nr:phosphate ABC transporter ATP-binding protein PstB [Sporolactobacillus terrae]BBN97600.1 phosphate import ATP-binding protein PstB [Sporolactobacillus terrae]